MESPLHSGCSPELLTDLAGNMWNAWSYLCLDIAFAGAVNWQKADELSSKIRANKREKAKGKRVADDDAEDDDEDSSQMPFSFLMSAQILQNKNTMTRSRLQCPWTRCCPTMHSRTLTSDTRQAVILLLLLLIKNHTQTRKHNKKGFWRFFFV